MHYAIRELKKKLLRGLCALAVAFGVLFSLTVPAYAQELETVPQETVPEETVAQTIPEETAPEETAPEETVPEETVPEETAPEETVPEGTVPEETVPETPTEAPVHVTFCYPERTESVAVVAGYSFVQMYPGIDPDTVTAEKENHTFLGWYASGDGGQTLASEPFDFRAPVTGDAELYPLFRLNVYTVTFVLEGQTLETVSVDHGADVTLPQIPPREGFRGVWSHDGRNITADTVITLEYIREGSGRFLLAGAESNFGGGRLAESAESLAKAIPLTEQERLLMEAGADVTVRLVLSSAGSASNDRALVEGILGEMTLCMYLEAELFKQVGQEPETELEALDSAVTVSFALPRELLPEEGTVRAFSVIRVHNGVAEAVDAVYNREKGVLSFASDRFSTFAVVCMDTEVPPPAITPSTGDGFHPGLWSLTMAGCGLALIVLWQEKKKIM